MRYFALCAAMLMGASVCTARTDQVAPPGVTPETQTSGVVVPQTQGPEVLVAKVVWVYETLHEDIGTSDGETPLYRTRHYLHVPDMSAQGFAYLGLQTQDGGTSYGAAFQMSAEGVRNGNPDEIADNLDVAIIWTPISLGVSGCLASGCLGSGCLASGCLASGCFGSGCGASGCGGSACGGSGCGGSGCTGSACGGSVCGGSGCAGSVCGGSACIGSVCGGSACVNSLCGGSACVVSACGGSGCVGSACVTSACNIENCGKKDYHPGDEEGIDGPIWLNDGPSNTSVQGQGGVAGIEINPNFILAEGLTWDSSAIALIDASAFPEWTPTVGDDVPTMTVIISEILPKK